MMRSLRLRALSLCALLASASAVGGHAATAPAVPPDHDLFVNP